MAVCRPGMWHKAKKVVLTTGQTEVKVEFPLPIVACNLMIEYADFYDNLQVSLNSVLLCSSAEIAQLVMALGWWPWWQGYGSCPCHNI